MFVRKTTRKQGNKTYTNYLLVEAIRTPKGPRQKVVCSLGDLSPRPRQEWLKLAHKVESALVGLEDLVDGTDPEVEEVVRRVREREAKADACHGTEPPKRGADEELVTVRVGDVTTERHREAGPVHVGNEFWKRLGIDGILREVGLREGARTLTCAMTLNRLVHPASEYAMPEWIRRTALEDILGVDFDSLNEDALYRNLDKLHPKRGEIEKALVDREQTLFNLDRTVFFYDLTSTYFEGMAAGNPKAKRGYSRDKRPDCKQVVVGLVVNRDGFPLGHEVFEGNRQDRNSLKDMLDVLDQRVGLQEGQTVVVDRGMALDENLEEIRSRKLHYLVAARQSERDQWLADFEDEEDFEKIERMPSPGNPFQKKSDVSVKLRRFGGGTHVLCVSSGRKEKDRAIRMKHEQRLLADLTKLEKRVREGKLKNPTSIGEAIGRLKERYPRVARYWHIEYDLGSGGLSFSRNEEKSRKAEELDGSYLLKSDRSDLSADEAWRVYILLTRAEAAFRAMKSPLAERPIFHQVEKRVETHIFLCVLAYHLLVAVEKTLLDQGIHTSWSTVRETLTSHQVCTTVLPTDTGAVLRIRQGSTPEPQHVELYDLLGVPHQVMPPSRKWSDPAPERKPCSDEQPT